MRVVPTVTTYNPSSANSNWRNNTAAADSGAAGASAGGGDKLIYITNPQVAGDLVGLREGRDSFFGGIGHVVISTLGISPT